MNLKIFAALAGNPNIGKSTLFNALTGSQQHVSNYPGITVEKKEGYIYYSEKIEENPAIQKKIEIKLVDLPGTYSLSSFSAEEIIACKVLTEEKPDIVINLVDANALERNLYLTIQLMELGLPVILTVNMIDEVEKQGVSIDINNLSKLLNIPVVPISAKYKKGLNDLLKLTENTYEQYKNKTWNPLVISYGPELDRCLAQLELLIKKEGFLTNKYPARWVAIKYLEMDQEIINQGRKAHSLSFELENIVNKLNLHLKETLNCSAESILADYRYGYISSVLQQNIINRPKDNQDRFKNSFLADKILTHRLFGPIIMLSILYLLYQLTFSLGEYPMLALNMLFSYLSDFMYIILPDGLIKSLIISGIIGGIGGILSFVPLIMIMFLLIAILEDSGYMARIAYMLDKLFKSFGLHGCSVMAFIISGGIAGGCAVPGILATRTLKSQKEKLATILTVPFLSCGAKLPIFLLISAVFFPENSAKILFLLTLTGWLIALIVAKILRSTVIKGLPTPFIMELPPYRTPTLRGIFIHASERTLSYIKKASTVVLALSIILWFSMSFPKLPEKIKNDFNKQEESIKTKLYTANVQLHLSNIKNYMVHKKPLGASIQENSNINDLKNKLNRLYQDKADSTLLHSWAGKFGKLLEPVSQLAGFNWRVNVALLGGLGAKEVIISTLGTSYSLNNLETEQSKVTSLIYSIKNDPYWTPLLGLSLAVFVLLYAPCFMTIITIIKETNSIYWGIFSVIMNTVIAFTISGLLYQLGKLL